jgi:hypothetical protein
LRWRGGPRGNCRIAGCVAAERSCRDYADGRRGGVDAEAWTWRCGRGGVGLDAGGRRPLPQSLRLVRDADSGLGSRRWTVDRVLAALGDSARGRPRSTRLRSDSAKASSARGATLARMMGVRVPRRIRSRSLGIPVLAAGARGAGGRRLRCRREAHVVPARRASWELALLRGGFVSAPSESGVGGQEFPPDVAGTSSGGLTVPPSPAGFGVGAGPEGRENPKKYRTALDRSDGVGEPTKHRTPIGTDTVLAQVGEERRQKATK